MKTITTLFFLASIISNAQEIKDNFRQQKRSIGLKTGICMSYVETGNPYGVPVLFLHGYTDTSRSFQLVIQNLIRLNSNLRIIAPDLRGHGDTSMPSDPGCEGKPQGCFGPEQMASDVIDLMDELCINKAVIVGHSMGGVVAQTMGIQYSERTQKLILLSTFVNGKVCDGVQDFLIANLIESKWKCQLENNGVRWPEQAYSVTPKSMGEKVVDYIRENWVVEPGAAKEFLEAILPETLTVPLGTWIGVIKSLGEIDYSAALENLKIPTLIVWSEQDVLINSKDQELLKNALRIAAQKHATAVVYKTYGKISSLKNADPLKDLGHNLHWAAPAEIAKDIDAFITGAAISNNLSHSDIEINRGVVTENSVSVIK